MRKLDFNEYKICQMLASIFESSIEQANFSSPMFIRRFMNSEFSILFQNKSYLTLSISADEIFDELNNKYKESTKNPLYTKGEMYWIGYIYPALSFLYELSFKQVYKMFSAKEIVKYYNIYHTFGIEEAAIRMMENIGYVKEDYTLKGLAILKRLYNLEKLENLIGSNISMNNYDNTNNVTFESNNISYNINYGTINEYNASTGRLQEAYIISLDGEDNLYEGRVVAVLNRKNGYDDKIVVATIDKEFTNEEIEEIIKKKENNVKYKIIRKK